MELFTEGPISIATLEILSYLSIYAPDFFSEHENEVLELMGVFYKNPIATSLESTVFSIYSEYIADFYKKKYTPTQASIIKTIKQYKNFSFSAPTSTGKSYVFRSIISGSSKDIVIIVPSRALINEYYDKVLKLMTDKTVNVLTFVDVINTKHAKRSIFILTPERAKELFKYKNFLNVELFLFDEAQLSDEESVRGLYFDSIVRRIQNAFPNSKCIFSHPFIANPNAQFVKNKFDFQESQALYYKQKNVGQIFFSHKNGCFYHFGIEKEIMGSQKILSGFDPLKDAIDKGRSILIYTTKASIYNKAVFRQFDEYLKICDEITEPEAISLINKLKDYIGANDSNEGYYHSYMIDLLKRGIVIHHGSLPLQARLLLEHFTQKGYCKICFATSTLEQGINMPFDVVYLNTFQASKTLSMKNLIGRSGRSTPLLKFDYGCVVVKAENMSNFRKIMLQEEKLNEISILDQNDENEADDYLEFKEAIKNGDFSDEYNLTNSEVDRLSDDKINVIIIQLLNSMFFGDRLLSLKEINQDERFQLRIYDLFACLYRYYLKDRDMTEGEASVLNTAIKILLWQVHCKTFKNICWYRYSYAAHVSERRSLEKQYREAKSEIQRSNIGTYIRQLEARFIRGYSDLPNKKLENYGLFPKGTRAVDVDYDRIVFDTYDYLDKLIGFKLSDIFYTIFYRYYEKTADERALRLSKYLKYGTDDERDILMLRYGFSFEDIECLSEYVDIISTEEIIFKSSIENLSPEQKSVIDRFIY